MFQEVSFQAISQDGKKKSTIKQLPPHPINLRFHYLKKKNNLPTGPYIFAIIPSGVTTD